MFIYIRNIMVLFFQLFSIESQDKFPSDSHQVWKGVNTTMSVTAKQNRCNWLLPVTTQVTSGSS